MPEERWSDMPMKEIPRIPEEEAEKLKGSRFVESVDGHMVLLTLEFHLMMYKRWKEFPSVRMQRPWCGILRHMEIPQYVLMGESMLPISL